MVVKVGGINKNKLNEHFATNYVNWQQVSKIGNKKNIPSLENWEDFESSIMYDFFYHPKFKTNVVKMSVCKRHRLKVNTEYLESSSSQSALH